MNSFKSFFKKSFNSDSNSSIQNILDSKYYYDCNNYSNFFQNQSNYQDGNEFFSPEVEYRKNGIFKRIIDEPVDNALRNWIEFKNEDKETNNQFESFTKSLDLKNYISKAFKMTRLFGSAIIILNFNDDKDLSEPVDFDEVTDFNILFVARYGNFMPFFTDNLIEPDYYYLTKTLHSTYDSKLKIHPDRVILMLNDPLYDDLHRAFNQSTTDCVKKYLVKLEYLYDSVSKRIEMSMIDILKFNSENLLNINNSSLVQEIQDKVNLISRGRSLNRMIGITDKDDIQRIEANLNNFADLIQKFQEELCSAADIPVQILFGSQTKGGLSNSSGDNVMDLYYNKIQSKQEVILKPILQKFFDLIARIYHLNEANFEFKSLYQLSELEKIQIEIEKINLEKARKSLAQ